MKAGLLLRFLFLLNTFCTDLPIVTIIFMLDLPVIRMWYRHGIISVLSSQKMKKMHTWSGTSVSRGVLCREMHSLLWRFLTFLWPSSSPSSIFSVLFSPVSVYFVFLYCIGRDQDVRSVDISQESGLKKESKEEGVTVEASDPRPGQTQIVYMSET